MALPKSSFGMFMERNEVMKEGSVGAPEPLGGGLACVGARGAREPQEDQCQRGFGGRGQVLGIPASELVDVAVAHGAVAGESGPAGPAVTLVSFSRCNIAGTGKLSSVNDCDILNRRSWAPLFLSSMPPVPSLVFGLGQSSSSSGQGLGLVPWVTEPLPDFEYCSSAGSGENLFCDSKTPSDYSSEGTPLGPLAPQSDPQIGTGRGTGQVQTQDSPAFSPARAWGQSQSQAPLQHGGGTSEATSHLFFLTPRSGKLYSGSL